MIRSFAVAANLEVTRHLGTHHAIDAMRVTSGKRAQSVALIALPTCDNTVPLGLANFQKVLPCQFDRGLDSL